MSNNFLLTYVITTSNQRNWVLALKQRNSDCVIFLAPATAYYSTQADFLLSFS